MNTANALRLLVLSAIWGASFPFMRVAVPALGPAWLIFLRVGVAAAFLWGVARMVRSRLHLRQYWRHYLVIGALNSALPFFLFAFAAQTTPVAVLSVLNATAPIWGAVLGAVWTRTLPGVQVVLGLLLGIAGVALLAGVELLHLPAGSGWGMAAALTAAALYSIASMYTRTAPCVEPLANAHGSLWAATVCMAPVALLAPPPVAAPSGAVLWSVLGLGVLCSGVAYLLYFGLVAAVGATSALTVTFLVPVFGIALGAVFLHEPVGWHTLTGSALVLCATALVTGLASGWWRRR